VFPSAAAVLSPPTIGFANDLTPLDAATAGSAARASHFPAFSKEIIFDKKMTHLAGFKDDIKGLINDELDKKLEFPEIRINEARELLELIKKSPNYNNLVSKHPADFELRHRAEQINNINIKDSLKDVPIVLNKLYDNIQAKIQFINEILKDTHENQSEFLETLEGTDTIDAQENKKLLQELHEKMQVLKWKLTDLEDDRNYLEDKDYTKENFNALLNECNDDLENLKHEEPSAVKNKLTALLGIIETAIDTINKIKAHEGKIEAEEYEGIKTRLREVNAKIEINRVKKAQPPEEPQALFERFKQELLKKTENKRASSFDDKLLIKTKELTETANSSYNELERVVEKIKEALGEGTNKIKFKKADLEKLLTKNKTQLEQLQINIDKQLHILDVNERNIQAKYRLGISHDELTKLTQEIRKNTETFELEIIRANTVRESVLPINVTNVGIAVAAKIPDQRSSIEDDNGINDQLDSILQAIETDKAAKKTEMTNLEIAVTVKVPKQYSPLFGDKGTDEDFMKSVLDWNKLQNAVKKMHDEVLMVNKSGVVKDAVETIYNVMSTVGAEDSRFDVLKGCLIQQIANLDDYLNKIIKEPDLLNSKKSIILVHEVLLVKKGINELLNFEGLSKHLTKMEDSDFISLFKKKYRPEDLQKEKWMFLTDFVLEELRNYEGASRRLKRVNENVDEIRKLIEDLDANVKREEEPMPPENARNILIGALIEKRDTVIKDKMELSLDTYTASFFKKMPESSTFDVIIDKILEKEMFGNVKGQKILNDMTFNKFHETYTDFIKEQPTAAAAA
ncbi:MAG: hypothetical protein WBE18_02095, partial [Gammaproteobacteria bacterium]